MKGKIGKRFLLEKDLPSKEFKSFYDSLFYANFCDVREPLLICGPSGYKTYLAEILSKNSNVINLYPETSLSQLLGSTHIRDNLTAKKYYLKEILLICGCISDYKELEKSLELYIKREEQRIEREKKYSSARPNRTISIFNENDFATKIQNMEPNINNEALKNILKQLKDNLLDMTYYETDKNNKFRNFTSYFQAGMILQNLLEQKNIILKGVDSLLPNVLERFNDLLNFNPKIILNEDLYNTFTRDQKEIKNISNFFRIIGISSIDNINNFSEASRSRFTLISTSKYTKEEKIYLLKIYVQNALLIFIHLSKNLKKRKRKIYLLKLLIKY